MLSSFIMSEMLRSLRSANRSRISDDGSDDLALNGNVVMRQTAQRWVTDVL
jgi:hypothetical protein